MPPPFRIDLGTTCSHPTRARAAAPLLGLLLGASWAPAVDHSFVEEFNTTTYRDAGNTTAAWDTAAGKVHLFPFTPTLLGTYDTPGNANNVFLAGDLAYVADYTFGIQIIDVGNPASPTLVGSYNTPGLVEGVAVSGTRAYVADGTSGLQILNVTSPASPTLLGTYNTPGNAWNVIVSGSRAYVADGSSGLMIVNVANPASPVLLGSYNTPGNAYSVAIAGTRAYVADGTSGLVILNVANPASPTLLGTYNTPGEAHGVVVSGTRAYVGDAGSGLQIIDVSNPAAPFSLGSLDTPGNAGELAIEGTVVFLADENSGMQVIDVSNPVGPTLLYTFDTDRTVYGLAVSGTRAYVGDDYAGLRIVEVGTTAGPGLLGSYDTPGTAYDVAISGTAAYVASETYGLRILDVSSPAGPTPLGSYDTPGDARGVAISGTVAYVADLSELLMIDVSNPASPTLLGSYDTPGDALRVTISGTVAYVGDGSSGLQILDVSNPASPSLLGGYDTPGTARGVAISGTVAYVADYYSGLQAIDVSNPASPSLLGSYDTPGIAYDVEISGTVAYVADISSGLQILDVSNPGSPTLLGSYDTPYSAQCVAISGTVAYVADGYPGVQVIDVSNPASPTLLGSYNTPDYAAGIAVSGTVAYVSDIASGLQILEVAQHRFDLARNAARSLAIDNTSDVIRRARVAPTQVDSVEWELTADGGADWQAVAPGTWIWPTPGSDLRWRATIAPVSPISSVTPPEVSRVRVDWLYDFAAIDSIADVPGDQGGWVRLWFARSAYDFADEPSLPITGYQIYRRVDDLALAARVEAEGVPMGFSDVTGSPLASFDAGAGRELGGRRFVLGAAVTTAVFPPGTWEVVSSVFATQSDEYLSLLPTNVDSTASGTNWSVYLVTAHTTTPSVWYASPPDSGYSIDNIAPGVPRGFVATPAGPAVDLAWDPSEAEDFQYFRVYRGATPDFPIDPGSLVQETAEVEWTDPSPGAGMVYYKLTALDHAGNESGAALASATLSGVEGARLPMAYALGVPAPNPFVREAVIRYNVPASGGAVRIGIYDVGGRLVRELVNGAVPAGERIVVWDGRDGRGGPQGTGLYFVRMQAPQFAKTRKLVLSR